MFTYQDILLENMIYGVKNDEKAMRFIIAPRKSLLSRHSYSLNNSDIEQN